MLDLDLMEDVDNKTLRLLDLIDKQVAIRGDAALAELDASREIARLCSEVRKRNVEMYVLLRHVKRIDRKKRKLVPVTRQAIDAMIAGYEQRRRINTTRASRARRRPIPDATQPAPDGQINPAIFS